MMATSIGSLSLPDVGVTAMYNADNTVQVSKKELWATVSIDLSADDAEKVYTFLKAQRTRQGLPT
jgi:hypothetical protein